MGPVLSEDPEWRPTRRSTASWVLYDMANTIFSFNILSAYFPVWLSSDLGLPDSVFAIGNSISMAIVFLLAPVLGALSDRARRRIPFLVASTTLCVFMTLWLGFVPWYASIGFFVFANVGFQAGLIFYDALLAVVSTPATVGRIGAIGIGVGYLGSLVGLGAGAAILTGHEDRDAWVFVATSVAFLVLALPSFFWVREPPRTTPPLRLAALRESARVSFLGLWALVRGAGDARIRRFLFGRVFYTDAANTMIAFMGIYAVQEAGFGDAGVRWVLLAGILGAAALAPLWGLLVDRLGAKQTLEMVLWTWMFGLLVVVLIPVLDLPSAVFFPTAFLLGGALGGTWSSDRPLMLGLAPPERLGEYYGIYAMVGRFSAILGPLAWALVVDGLHLGRPAAVLTLLVFMLVSYVILRPLQDPHRPGPSRLARFLPWRRADGTPLPRPARWWLRFPAHVVYAIATVALFLVFQARYGGDLDRLPAALFRIFVYEIPSLFTDPARTLANFALTVWAQHDKVQLIYVLVLLGLFGARFEVREGTRRAVTVFYATSIGAALFAGLLLHVLHAAWDAAWIERAWEQGWTGGSAGAFGLMGAFAARARNPWLFLGIFAAWELNVGAWYLRSYTPAFHLTALALGFLMARYAMPPREHEVEGAPAPRPQRPASQADDPDARSGAFEG